MEESTTTYLGMFDRVVRLEPQLRDTLKAVRQTAKQSIDICYLNLRWQDDETADEDDEEWYETWIKAIRQATDFDENLKNLIASLSANSEVMQSNGRSQNENAQALEQSAATFLRSLSLDEKSAAAVETYLTYRAALMAYQQERNGGNWRAQPPVNIDNDIFSIVLPLLETDTSEQTVSGQAVSVRLQQEQASLCEQFEGQRKLLKAAVAEMDKGAESLDQANLSAAKAVKAKLDALPKTPYLRAIGRSAVDTCTAVIALSKRVAVVNAHPPTMGDVNY